MLLSKLDIFRNEWLNIIFAGRNQQYGAYCLRQGADADTVKSLVIGISLFVLVIGSSFLAHYVNYKKSADDAPDKLTVVTLTQPPPVDKTIVIPPPPVEPPPPRVDQVRMPPPVVVKSDLVKEEPPTINQLKRADPGPETIAGDPSAEIRIDLPIGEGPKDQQMTEGVNYDGLFEAVEIPPTPQGGMNAFYQFIAKTYQYPAQAQENGVNGKVLVQFVVEKDGSLTDIKVLRDLKYGTGEEAVRMLKKAPKWKPGFQNGRAVRVQFTIPIQLNLSAQ